VPLTDHVWPKIAIRIRQLSSTTWPPITRVTAHEKRRRSANASTHIAAKKASFVTEFATNGNSALWKKPW
jgi:hypothetical protein